MRFICCFLLISTALFSQKTTIILEPEAHPGEQRAAAVLKYYLEQITQQPVTVLNSARKPWRKSLIFIGNKNKTLPGFEINPPQDIPEDAFYLEGKNGAFCIAGGGDMGAEYGVYTFLEMLGCRKYSPRDSFIPQITEFVLPECPPTLEKPAFPYRELWYEPATNEAWARWHKLKTRPQKQADWGMFVHTFDQLCPAKTYFEQHPGYFSYNGAQRSPGQLCLSNDTVCQVVIENLRQKIQEKPAAKYWSVSQNDNYDYCKCRKCATSDANYGGPAGTLLAFVNKVAAAFPDKIISTLAYQYTRKAPKGIRPADNVSVCLCSIECNRGEAIETGCRDFANDLDDWSAITNHLMVWDYVVQFRSYVSPFPNWHTLQPNLQLFQKRGVKMMFEQGSGSNKSEFSDMRGYILAKLMWNPQANMDSILQDFGRGYYGAARPIIWDYIHQLSENVKNTNRELGIYATPQMEMKGFLHPEKLEKYLGTFRKGRLAVSDDSLAMARLEEAFLPLRFALMEIGKTCKANTIVSSWLRIDYDHCRRGMNLLNYGLWEYEFDKGYRKHCNILNYLNLFVTGCQKHGYKDLHEMGYSPDKYQEEMLHFLENALQDHSARYTIPSLKYPASSQYENGKADILTDALCGSNDYHFNWLGFQGNDLVATLDFKTPIAMDTIETHFLQDQQSWVFLPTEVVFEVSNDGVTYNELYAEKLLNKAGPKSVATIRATFEPVRARFLRVRASSLKKCPNWHNCNGNPCWIFTDEIIVR